MRIVSEKLWKQVTDRLGALRKKYVRRKPSRVPGPRASYLLSGLLVCAECGTNMIIHGGGPGRRYYKCGTYAKRGTCPNTLSVRESIARECILTAVKDELLSGETLREVQERLVAEIREWSKRSEQLIAEARNELSETEARIDSLVDFIAGGDHSPKVRDKLASLERLAGLQQADIRVLEVERLTPIPLPTARDVMERLGRLDALDADVAKGRERLRRLLGGTIRMIPEEGRYFAECDVFPLRVLLSDKETPPASEPPEVLSSDYCGGRI